MYVLLGCVAGMCATQYHIVTDCLQIPIHYYDTREFSRSYCACMHIRFSYCLKNYDPDKEDSKDVYLCLIKMYLSPPNLTDYGIKVPEGSQPEPNVDDALRVLMSHHHVIDTAKVQ